MIEAAAESQETDMLGMRALPKDALYGIHTLRAIENFDENDLTITLAAGAGHLQLTAMEPVMVLNLLQSIRLFTRGIEITTSCIDGSEANVSGAASLRSFLGLSRKSYPLVVYNRAAMLAMAALDTGASLREVVSSDNSLSEQQRASILLLLG